MADSAETTIAAIHTRLNTLAGVTITYAIGETNRLKNTAPPRIDWVYARSKVEPPDLTGGNPKQVATDLAAFKVHIWHTTREMTRLWFHGLMTAAHDAGYGHNVRWTAYEWVGERTNLKKGFMIVADVTIRVPAFEPQPGDLTLAGDPEALMTGQTHEVFVGLEAVC